MTRHRYYPGQEGVTFYSDGYRLLGTLFTTQSDTPRPTAILLHGVPGIEKNYDLALALRGSGWNSLLFHFRGSWGSQGTFSLKTIPSDVQAAVELLDSGKFPMIDRNLFVLIGHSLGGWAAVLAGAGDERIKGVCVYGAVTDPETLVFSRTTIAEEFIPWLNGIDTHNFATEWSGLTKEFSAVNQVAALSPTPLLIIHSLADEVVPYTQSQSLYDYAKEPRQLLLHPNANHSFTWHRTWLQSKILAWLEHLEYD